MSLTRLRTNLPYLQPKRPELPVTFPFAVLFELAMMVTHRSVYLRWSLQLIYLIEDFYLTLSF